MLNGKDTILETESAKEPEGGCEKAPVSQERAKTGDWEYFIRASTVMAVSEQIDRREANPLQ